MKSLVLLNRFLTFLGVNRALSIVVGQEIHPREYSPMKMTVVLVVRHEGRHGTYSTAFKGI